MGLSKPYSKEKFSPSLFFWYKHWYVYHVNEPLYVLYLFYNDRFNEIRLNPWYLSLKRIFVWMVTRTVKTADIYYYTIFYHHPTSTIILDFFYFLGVEFRWKIFGGRSLTSLSTLNYGEHIAYAMRLNYNMGSIKVSDLAQISQRSASPHDHCTDIAGTAFRKFYIIWHDPENVHFLRENTPNIGDNPKYGLWLFTQGLAAVKKRLRRK